MQKNLPTRRVWAVMDMWASNVVYFLGTLLVLCAIEYNKGAFEKDPYQTYTFCLFQLPFHALVVYVATCMMHIGYHLAILGKFILEYPSIDSNLFFFVTIEDCTEASKELIGQIDLAKRELAKKNKFFVKEFDIKA